jgi:ribosome-associated protein
MDFGDVVAHVFRSDVRAHYALEKLWGDANRVRLPSQKPGEGEPDTGPARKSRSLKTGKQG